MEFVKTYKQSSRPVVFLFSEPESLPLYILENLLSSLCRVVVFSNRVKIWETSSSHIAKGENLVFDSYKNYKKYPRPNYFLSVDLSKTNPKSVLENAVSLMEVFACKGFLVASEENGHYFSSVVLPENLGVVLVKDLFGPRMELDGRSRISQVIKSLINGERLKVADNENVSLVYLGDAAKTIVKWLFSFGPYGEVVSISSKERPLSELYLFVKNIYPEFKYSLVHSSNKVAVDNKRKTHLIDRNYNDLLKETLVWFKNGAQLNKKAVVKTRVKMTKSLGAVIVAAVLLISPFVFMVVSALLLLVSSKLILNQKLKTSSVFMNASYVAANVANKESVVFAGIPLLGGLYRPAASFSYVIKNASVVGLRGLNLVDDVKALSGGVLGDGDYNLSSLQERISSNFGFIETTLSFMEGEAKTYPNIYKKVDIAKIKKLTANLNKVSLSLSDILGTEKTKTYLILFQNNMELRPTGGFIGSFALASFNSGKLTDITVQDVYSADGQLKGHIEPPEPIKKYLGEANWFLRDSNWDPDFPTSAERAEWFLDKEIDVPVDGVIAIDLNVIKDLLEVVGPIYLDDYQMQITKDNFYERTQSEVEGDFFPGSTKKASFITALSKEMINTLVLNKDKESFRLARIFYDNLEGRHVQVFLHNDLARNALSNLNWDGAFNYPNCSGNCFSDFLGLVEANLGVNKSNYYIERTYNLDVSLQDGLIKKNLSVSYKNSANPAIGEKAVYKTYVRLFVPTNAVLESLKIEGNSLQPDINTASGKKEVGFYMEVLPGQTKTMNILWQEQASLSLARNGEYLLYFRKQAGVGEEPISITYRPSSGIDLSIEPGYNTLFSKDIYSKVSWKK